MTRRDPDARRRAGQAYLVVSAVGAANTANARRPVKRTGRAGVLGFFPGWLTSELPLHAIAWQVLATVVFARRGALRTARGVAGLAVSLVSWSVLGKIWKQSIEAGAVYDEALRAGLGDDLDRVRPGEAPPVPRGDLDRRRIVAGPLTRWRRRYVQGPTIRYGDAGRRNELDVWRRPDLALDGKAPVLVQVHGGAWVIGNKEQQALPLLAHMAERGWVCVSINYRLSPRATWPDHIVDVKRALAWVKANIAQYGGDPDFVCITGGSAGGHLSSLAALTADEPVFQPGFEDADTSVVAAVPIYGVYDLTNRDGTGRADMDGMLERLVLKASRTDAFDVWEQASSMTWVGHDPPPFFVIHGENDSLVPVEQARSFVAMLRAASTNAVVYAELPGAQHAFEVFDSPRTMFTSDAVHRFLEAVRIKAGHGLGTIEEPHDLPADASAVAG
jgi:acetyl esterase/lipase